LSKSKSAEHRVGLEPTLPHYGCGVLAAGRPVLVVSVGPDGLEPSPARLRAECAAANTSIPSSIFSVGLGGVEPSSGLYKEPALTVELQAQRPMGPEGFEPTPAWLKARDAAVTPRPRLKTWRRLLRCSRCMTISFALSLGVELNHRFRRIRTMCFRYTTKRSRDGQNRTDCLVCPRHAGDRCPSPRTTN